MARKLDLIGTRFGRLLVKSEAANRGYTYRWDCLCDCGTATIVDGKHLRSGATVSCGCYHSDRISERFTTHGATRAGQRHPLYKVWCNMRARCFAPTDAAFTDYGARGITVCPSWEDFAQFLIDMGPKPSGTSLERIDNNGPYAPDNCRWATPLEQANNRRSNTVLVHAGRSLTLAQWSRETGIKRTTISARINVCGWTVEKALTR